MNKNFYSPTMLTRYINCKHIISNEYYEKSLKLKRNEKTTRNHLGKPNKKIKQSVLRQFKEHKKFLKDT